MANIWGAVVNAAFLLYIGRNSWMEFAETAGAAAPPSTREIFLFAVVYSG